MNKKLNKGVNSYPHCEITRRGFEADIIDIETWLNDLDHVGHPAILKSINLTNKTHTTKVYKSESQTNSDFINGVSQLTGYRITNVEADINIGPIHSVEIKGNIKI